MITYDERVLETERGNVKRITAPAAWPASPTMKIKGLEVITPEGYTKSGDEITFNTAVYYELEIEVYDGAALVWKWSALQGDIVGS